MIPTEFPENGYGYWCERDGFVVLPQLRFVPRAGIDPIPYSCPNGHRWLVGEDGRKL